uniref:Secreted protein n=1 Tax=Cynoglossus semilaevis TaxID=244447 RepID=A0A3P8WAS2_CYNSE
MFVYRTLPESRLLALILLTWDSAMSARSSASSSSYFCVCYFYIILSMFYPRFKFLELLLATLHGQVLSLIQTMLQVLNSNFQVLLHPLQVSTSVLIIKVQLSILKLCLNIPELLLIQCALHGVDHPLAVSLNLLHLLILFCQLPVNLTLDLVELQLNTQDLRFFMLQSSLRL